MSSTTTSPPATDGIKKPYLITLPEDTEALQIIALAFTMHEAHTGYVEHIPLSPGIGLPALAHIGAQRYLSTEVDGKQGTNDRKAYSALFQQVVRRAYPAMLALLRREPWLVAHLNAFPHGTPRWIECHRAAQANVHLLATPGPFLPLTWPMVKRESEVC